MRILRRISVCLRHLLRWLIVQLPERQHGDASEADLPNTLRSTVQALERGYLGVAVGRLTLKLASIQVRGPSRAAIEFGIACVFSAAGCAESAENLLREVERDPEREFIDPEEFRVAIAHLVAHAHSVASPANALPLPSRTPAAVLAQVLESSSWHYQPESWHFQPELPPARLRVQRTC